MENRLAKMCFLPKRERVQKLFLSLLAGTLIALPSGTHAELVFGYGTEKEFVQFSASGPRFDGGSLVANLRDGNAIYNAACPFNNSLFAFGAIPLIGCYTGSTGIVSSGDFDHDGYQDDNTYWEITSAIRAAVIEPFRDDLCKLIAAPASKLTRPLEGEFFNEGFSVFWNTRSTFMQEYDIAWYDMSYDYGTVNLEPDDAEGKRMLEECVVGQYVYQFPSLGNVDLPRNLMVRLYPFIEGYSPSTSDGRKGFKFLGSRWDEDGNYQVDPRLLHTFQWQTAKNKLVATDKLFFQIDAHQDITPTNGIDDTHFPPDGDPLFIQNIQATSYTMPPGFFQIGQTAMAKLQYFRALGVSAVSFDRSIRAFKLPIRFVETYAGYAAYGDIFPRVQGSAKTLAALKAGTGDFDKDGINNVTEFALMSDPAGSPIAVASIASTATAFTITFPTAHGRTAGEAILLEGVTPAAYNDSWTIAGVTTNTITVKSTLNPGDGSGGVMRRIVGAYPVPIVSITSTPTQFTIVARNHGKAVGDEILISGGVTNTAYKGLWVVSAVTQDTLLTDEVVQPGTITVTSNANPGPATGGIIKLAIGDATGITDITSTPTTFSMTSLGHGASVGELVLVQDAVPAGYNGLWLVAAITEDEIDPITLVVTPGTITVSSTADLGAGAGGTVQPFVPDLAQLTEADFAGETSAESYARVHTGGIITLTILKRPSAGSSITYGIETKATATTKKWSKVKFGSKWAIDQTQTDETKLVIVSDGTVPLSTLIRPVATENF
jgi:hypothetical protein